MLVLCLIGLVIWYLNDSLRQQVNSQRQQSLLYTAQLADHLSLNMRLKAGVAGALMHHHAQPPSSSTEMEELLHNLRHALPNLLGVAWVSADGSVIHDTLNQDMDPVQLQERLARSHSESFFYSFSTLPNGHICLFLRQSQAPESGYWILRLDTDLLSEWLKERQSSSHGWLLEDADSQRVIASDQFDFTDNSLLQPSVTAQNSAQSSGLTVLPGSNWQLHTLFNYAAVHSKLMREQAGKLLLLLVCSGLTLVALYRLLHEQRSLLALNSASRRYMLQAGSVLGAIEERVLVTDLNGQLQYLNPQAEEMFGLSNRDASGWDLLKLMPRLDPLLLHSSGAHGTSDSDLVEIRQNGNIHLYDITRSDLTEHNKQIGFVWVLRDVTEEQRASQVLQETRRRYQDIFDGTGTALCVLDLTGLQRCLQQHDICNDEQLRNWLDADPRHHDEISCHLQLTESNDVALNLFGVDSNQSVWQHLFNNGLIRPNGLRMQLLLTLINGGGVIEMEKRITTQHGQLRHLWILLRLPEAVDELKAITLSISDITNRKLIENSLIERERFWSDVVNAVPDTIYVNDLSERRELYSNNHLGPQLGYNQAEIEQLGESFWEKILHPDDSELYQRTLNALHVIGDGVLMQYELRWRHRDGSWRWFEIREQALARDSQGRVSRMMGVAKDITEEIARRESLQASEQRYRLLAESITDVIISTDALLNVNYVSPSVETVLGYESDWVRQHGLFSLAANTKQIIGAATLLKRVSSALGDPLRMNELRQQFIPQVFVFDCLHADGHTLPIELRLLPMWDDNGRFEGLLGIARDISLQRRAEKDLRMAATVFEHSTAAIMVTDPVGYIVQINNAFTRVTGYTSKQIIDQLPNMLTVDNPQQSQLKYITNQLRQMGSWEGELLLKRRNDETFPAWVGITAIRDDEGDLISYVGFFSDISERKANEQRIHRLAYYDPLTQLPNRTLFQDRLHTVLQQAERNREWVALMFLDLDRFKPINDSLGHAAGDRMLKEVAQRLSLCVDGQDTLARMGGDEFTLLLYSQNQRETALTRAIHVGEQILARLAQPFVLEGREFFVSASIGIALSPQDGNELSQLMKNADTAMYHAKERGKNNFQFYQAEMNASALQRIELESDLRHALAQDEFQLVYQPQFSSDGKRLTGVEALLRWEHPQRGNVSPASFIPVLEEIGLVVQVGDWVLQRACRQLALWHEKGVDVPKISVNISPRQFSEGDLHLRIAEALRQSGIPAGKLELEITESILMEDVAAAMHTLTELKELGVYIAIDDFGTGYSSLNYLKQFPLDVLKIDRSFVDNVPHGEKDAQIARAIIAMAHSLDLTVIAEGVENQEQLDFLRTHNCDEVQGFLLGRPMPARQFTPLFSNRALFMLS
ncbi:diguanylate cyclase [Pseudomonas sp. TTU2014-080ASC]|uniref:bifunctional diguanylate cyclase/phosphodiesterase n=1 Tax=Pseudomonas sp. TTU2014-080ASC TaxID=1729724 RepID=UPI00071847F9|nr:EAL domain-containing protein [Pseudomonas sp. TTU2014-080ASC]KRW62954.1 diguanylate cyclase [Pseudomonas sp. TTU2014-080ASC]